MSKIREVSYELNDGTVRTIKTVVPAQDIIALDEVVAVEADGMRYTKTVIPASDLLSAEEAVRQMKLMV